MSLEAHLVESGYLRIPLTRSGLGHFHAVGRLGDREVSVLLDTGAGKTIVSLKYAEAVGLPLSRTTLKGGGAGAARMDIHQIAGTELRLGDLALRVQPLLSMDLSNVDEALRRKGEPPIEVVVGVDVFDAHSAVIDYGSRSLFLKP